MELLTLQWLSKMLLLVAAGLVVGFLIGSRRSSRRLRRLERDLGRQQLEIMDHNAELAAVERQKQRYERQERLIKLALQRLRTAETRVSEQQRELTAQRNRHRVELAQLNVQAEQARERCRAATVLARTATAQLKSLTGSGLAAAPALPSAANGHSDKRLAKDSLQVVRGIDNQTEQTLNAAGIHRVEQLAELTESELVNLHDSVESANGPERNNEWVGGVRELIQRQMPVS